ncbi:hypothetical protein OKW45_005374 [Paraburkholderia sp. WSM4175]|uniref:DUF262 domain-containing protein n=1 Tax=Paraburkholderia sp. WSM4175 TaxID=2991072 RepID=UPI003D20164C
MLPYKTSAAGLFSQPVQYMIPVFQRGYVWTLKTQVAPLWTDITDRVDALIAHKKAQASGLRLEKMQSHFLGSVVLERRDDDMNFGRVNTWEVIDGQQRTTTLYLLMLALRDVAARLPEKGFASMLAMATRNEGAYSDPNDCFKVWPTEAGREDIRALTEAGSAEEVCRRYPLREKDAPKRSPKRERPLMVQSYLYLYHATLAYMRGLDLTDSLVEDPDATLSDKLIERIEEDECIEELSSSLELDATRLYAIHKALDGYLQLMTLKLDDDDDPQVIFETLNARGAPLLASDLVRNFIFLQAHREETKEKPLVQPLYAKYWKGFDAELDLKGQPTSNNWWRVEFTQGRLTYPRIDLFFFHYVVLRRAAEIKVANVFQGYKEWWSRNKPQLETELSSITRSAQHFREFISPAGDSAIADFSRMAHALDVSTVTPVYLFLRERYETDDPLLGHALKDLESYIVRRAICGATTKGYNRVFLKLLEHLAVAEDPALAIGPYLGALSGTSQAAPTDETFKERWLNRPVYKELKQAKVSAVFRRLELAMRTAKHEAVPVPAAEALTLEHVLPQSWEQHGYYPLPEATPEAMALRQMYLHSFGNLTLLTGPLNSAASNDPFEVKRLEICKSLYVLNHYFQVFNGTAWGDVEIRARGTTLFEIALTLWPAASVRADEPAEVTP